MADWAAGGGECSSYWGDREAYRRWPRPTPTIPALRRRAPTVRFITFETLGTGVPDFECALSIRTSSFVHGLMTRRAVFAFTVLVDFVPLTVLFKALGIIQVLHLNGSSATRARSASRRPGSSCTRASIPDSSMASSRPRSRSREAMGWR